MRFNATGRTERRDLLRPVKPCSVLRLRVWSRHIKHACTSLEYWFQTWLWMHSSGLGVWLHREDKQRNGRRMCNRRCWWCGKCLSHGAAEQYVVHNTISAALHQRSIFQNTTECLHQRLSDNITFNKQFLCHNVTITLPQSLFECLHERYWR